LIVAKEDLEMKDVHTFSMRTKSRDKSNESSKVNSSWRAY